MKHNALTGNKSMEGHMHSSNLSLRIMWHYERACVLPDKYVYSCNIIYTIWHYKLLCVLCKWII